MANIWHRKQYQLFWERGQWQLSGYRNHESGMAAISAAESPKPSSKIANGGLQLAKAERSIENDYSWHSGGNTSINGLAINQYRNGGINVKMANGEIGVMKDAQKRQPAI